MTTQMQIYLGLDSMNKNDRIYTREYENTDYRWWNPLHWIHRTETYEQDSMSPITIRYRRNRISITADSIGHHLVEQCKDFS